MSYGLSLYNNPSCQTLQKALDKSKNTFLFLSKDKHQNWIKFHELLPTVIICKDYPYENLIDVLMICH